MISIGNRIRQAGIRLYCNWKIRPFTNRCNHRIQLCRPQGTIDANGIYPKPFQRQTHGRNRTASKSTLIFLKCHGAQNRFIRMLFCCQNSCLQLIQIGHGFKYNQIAGIAGFNLFPENIVCFLKRKRSGWFQKLPNRANIQSNQGIRPGTGSSGIFNAGFDDFRDRITAVCQFIAIGTKCIGINNIRTSLNIFLMNFLQQFRLFQVQHLGCFSHFQSSCLEHRSHCAI